MMESPGRALSRTLDQQNVRLISAIVGEDLTLACVVDHSDVQFFWYRQRLGRKPQIICSVYSFQEVAKFHHEFKDNPRFRLEKKDDQMNLRIADAQPTDSATYFCMSGRDVVMEFKEAITVRVEKSRLTVHSVVHQPQFENFQPGALTFTSILSVFLSVLLVKRNKENCCKCSDSTREISAPSTTNEEGYGDEENLHYAALSVHNRTRRRMDNVENDCVYSSVRH
uniref:Uncharacterized LOC103391489 n=1 Tax=Cynoglossus semilaevis TaxID=244447 RepID=A0A3P8W687_CYNSE